MHFHNEVQEVEEAYDRFVDAMQAVKIQLDNISKLLEKIKKES